MQQGSKESPRKEIKQEGILPQAGRQDSRPEAKGSSRRDFIKSVGCFGLALGALSVTGCSSQTPTNDTVSKVEDISWDETWDIIVVGAGLAGTSAAVTVATEGEGAKCLLLEKSPADFGGGNSPYSSGYVLYAKSAADITVYLKALRGHMTNTPDDVIEAYAKGLTENLEWAYKLGLTDDMMRIDSVEKLSFSFCWPEYPELPGCDAMGTFIMAPANMSNEDFVKLDPAETHIARFMAKKVSEYPDAITELTKAPLTGLIQDPTTKTVLGVIYEYGGKTVYAKATRGVIMCCGGFENNPEMVQDYLSMPVAFARAAVHNTGDGHLVCQKIGTAFWHMNSYAGFWNNIRKLDGSAMGNYFGVDKGSGITVSRGGRRFYMDWDACVLNDWPGQDRGDTFETAVGCRHGHFQFGGEWPHLPMPAESWFIFDAAHLEKAYGTNGTDPIADGFGYKADSIADLAKLAGLPVEELEQTVATWNGYCKAGRDLSFFRPLETLASIEKAPFYALRCAPEWINTDGGPVRNAKGEVLDLDGKVIPGLYSAGEFGSVWSEMYQGAGNLGECMAYGRISARNCLAR
ncbi:MAG: FAD-binding protein [Coriobacteriaceae bacterium]|jgi:succinate dehydrogenase/fumarate reductase flavoprotein subunit|nr:FAD-binding protein [Coriobacteriaceae bacterium]